MSGFFRWTRGAWRGGGTAQPGAARALLCLWLLLAIPMSAHAQVRLRATLARNDTLRYDLHAVLAMGTDTKDPDRLEQTARIRLTVADVDRDGNATLRMAFETLAVKRHAAGGDSEYPSPEKGDGADSPLVKAYSELSGSILELEVSADGEIGSVAGMESTLKAAHDAGVEEPSRLLGVLSPESLAGTLAPVLSLDRSGEERKTGESWTETRTVPLVDPYTARIGTRLTLKALNGDAADLMGPVTVSLHARSVPDATPTLSISDQSGTVSAQWNRKTLRLVSYTLDQRVSWKAALDLKEPIVTSRTTTTRLDLKAVE